MTFTIHLPHWLAYIGEIVGGMVIGAILMHAWIRIAMRDAIGRRTGW